MRYAGKIGFVTTAETEPGIWEETAIERKYYGEVIQASRELEPSQDTTNFNVNVTNRISIVGDAFANTNYYSIRYLYWRGSKWRVKSVTIQYPRLVLSIGGLWNDDSTGIS